MRGHGLRRTAGEQRRLTAPHIPKRFRHSILDDYETAFGGTDASLDKAHLAIRRFAREYCAYSVGNDLLFAFSVGAGKAHLEAGVLYASYRNTLSATPGWPWLFL
jgi:hypothetical protein